MDLDAALAELDRKEALIQKLQRGLDKSRSAQEELQEQCANLIEDRDIWRRAAQEGSRTANRTINSLKAKIARLEGWANT